MIELINRKDVFESNNLINSVVKGIQNVFFDDDILEIYKEDGEDEVYKLKFDALEFVIEFESWEKIVKLNHKGIETFTEELTTKIEILFQHLGVNKIICLSHLKSDLFGNRDNEFKPLQKSYSILESITNSKSYHEAIKFDIIELRKIIEILFWTTRCDPSIPEIIFLFDENCKVSINICKFGNIHIAEFNHENLTNDVLKEMELELIENCGDDNFSENGKIMGRTVIK